MISAPMSVQDKLSRSPCLVSVSQQSSSSVPVPRTVYTVFTSREKYFITFLLGLTTITSPLTATIYFPLLPLLRAHFATSAQAINLTITLYIVFQALSPAVFATLSDSLGRRPIYLITLTLYVLANLGLALAQDSYAALLILRAIQSLGASAAFAVSYGVVADVSVPAERGKMLGPVTAALNLGTCIGPMIGGWVAFKSGGYGWVFWCLFIVGGVLLVAVGCFLPETARNVVGNGSLGPRRWWAKTWSSHWSGRVGSLNGSSRRVSNNKGCSGDDVIVVGDRYETLSDRKNFEVRNLLACLRIIFWKDTALILGIHGWFYLVDYCIQTTIPSTFKDIYHFDELQIGLSYLPRGAGIIAGGYVNGRFMDRNYKVTAAEIGHTIDRVAGDSMKNFPIEKARLRGCWYLLGILSCDLIGYGWVLENHGHVSIPLILQFFQGILGTSLYTVSSTLLVDSFPESPSTAAAAASITRCALAASGVVALQPMLDALGRGWYFTTLGLVSSVIGSAAAWAVRAQGMKWRLQRRAKTAVSLGCDDSGELGQDEPARTSPGTKEQSRPTSSGEAEVEHKNAVRH